MSYSHATEAAHSAAPRWDACTSFELDGFLGRTYLAVAVDGLNNTHAWARLIYVQHQPPVCVLNLYLL